MKKRRYKKKSSFSLWLSIITLVLIMGIVAVIGVGLGKDKKDNNSKESSLKEQPSSGVISEVSSVESKAESSEVSSVVSVVSKAESKPQTAQKPVSLDEDYERLLLVNGENPLSKDYNYTGNLITIPSKYLCGWRNQMDKDAWVYTKAMLEAAWKDNVELYVLSPYRDYGTQETLYNNEVKKWQNKGMSFEDAKNKAATVVARPGTSEHHTGLAIDFNSVEDSFENTESYRWLEKNAADYGFIMRYSKEKQPITGVIHESWHWRFVGIKHARKIKSLGICLEEYLELQ